jgi:hypothetical protein
MATNEGPIKFRGSFGNMRGYYDSGLKRNILSTKGGANKNLIKNSPAFAQSRKCMNEFAGCSKFASMVRMCLLSISQLMYSRYYSGIVRLSKEIQVRDMSSTFGFRNVESSKSAWLLREINFNKQYPFQGVIRDAFGVVFSQDKKTVQFSMIGFIPRLRLLWPTPFAAFRLYLLIGQVSDLVWSEHDRCYMPAVQGLGHLTRYTVSEWMSNGVAPLDILMETSFDAPAFREAGTTVIVALGIELATSVTEGSAYIPRGNGTVGIVECYVG